MATCVKCNTNNLTWSKSVKGNWYLGTPYLHTFEDGNQTTTHVMAHNCQPTPEGLAAMEARQAEKAAEAAELEAKLEFARQEKAKLHHIEAEVGAKVTFSGVVTMATTVETQFGSSRLVVVQTADYQVAKMFTTAEWAWDVDFDDVVMIQGTVKSHDEYEGIPQTMIARPKKIGN